MNFSKVSLSFFKASTKVSLNSLLDLLTTELFSALKSEIDSISARAPAIPSVTWSPSKQTPRKEKSIISKIPVSSLYCIVSIPISQDTLVPPFLRIISAVAVYSSGITACAIKYVLSFCSSYFKKGSSAVKHPTCFSI